MTSAYVGNMQLPSAYIAIEEEEMEYLEGGGTLRVYISERAMRSIITNASATAVSLVVFALTKSRLLSSVAGVAARLIVGYVTKHYWRPQAVSFSVSAWCLPNYNFTYN